MSLRQNRDFILLLMSDIINNIGNSLYFIGAMWLVYDLSSSSLFVGIATFLIKGPGAVQFLFGPFVDRWNLKRTLVGTYFFQGIAVLAIPIAAYYQLLSVWVVLVVILLLSVSDQLVIPAHPAALPRIVSDRNLPQANSLIAVTGQGLNAIFNVVGGVLIALLGVTTLFVIDSVTFFAGMVLLTMITIPSASTNGESQQEDFEYVTRFREGLRYLDGSLLLRLTLIAAITNFGYGAVLAAIPAFADSFGGSLTYGWIMGAIALGTVVGAVGGGRFDDFALGRFLVVGYLATSVTMGLAAYVTGFVSTLGLLFLSSIPAGAYSVIMASMTQSIVRDDLLGRVMAVTQSLTNFTVPIGGLLGGFITAQYSPVITIYGLSSLYLICGIFFAITPRYRSLGSIDRLDAETLKLSLGD